MSTVSTVTLSPIHISQLAKEAQIGAQKLADDAVGSNSASLRNAVKELSRLEEIARLACLEPGKSSITLTLQQADKLITYAREARPDDQKDFSPSITQY